MSREQKMTPKEFEEFRKHQESLTKTSFSKSYKGEEVTLYSMVKEHKNSALYLVLKITLKDGKVVNTEQIGEPEYKSYAYNRLRLELLRDEV